jgi:hypothetical protein
MGRCSQVGIYSNRNTLSVDFVDLLQIDLTKLGLLVLLLSNSLVPIKPLGQLNIMIHWYYLITLH